MSRISFLFKGEKYQAKTRVNTYIFDYPCTTKDSCFPIECAFIPGQYLLEVWGAQGGSFAEVEGGKGGYSRGFLTIKKTVKAYLFIGAEGTITPGTSMSTNFSFNGGGIGKAGSSNPASSGGGGTDVRIGSESIFNRVIVAGGGGGSSQSYDKCIGGAGGGENGIIGELCSNNEAVCAGKPGTQTSGTFWSGGNRTDGDGCGGGGGWFGGGNGYWFETSGSGGSGFIFNSSNYQIALKAKLALPRRYFLKHGVTIDGLSSFPSPLSLENETGHTGSGSIRITYFPENHCRTHRIMYRGICYSLFYVSLFYC